MSGLVWFFFKNQSTDHELLNNIVKVIKHEKFHQVNKYINSFFGVAKVHLGIFNPEPQPIFNEDKSLCIFFDSKTYDYENDMNILKDKHMISIGNDPEFCLHSYEEYGIDFIKKLEPSFIFIICNLKDNKIIIVNDRYGLKSMYYT